MRAVGHALAAELLLAGHVHLAPARTGGDDHGLGLEAGAVLHLHFVQVFARHHAGDALQVHHVDFVFLDVLLKGCDQLGAFGVFDRDEVLDRHRVHDLAAEALGHHAGADTLARGIDRRRRAGRATADDEHVERRLLGQLLRVACGGAGVDLGEDLAELEAALVELLAVQVHRRHRHDLALLDLLLEQCAVDHGVADLRVEHRHQVERLHHVRAVVAGQRDVGLEVELDVEGLDLLDHLGLDLGRVAAGLQQGEDQRSELVAHGQAGEAHARLTAARADREGGLAFVVVATLDQGDQLRLLGDVVQQLEQLLRLRTIIQRRHDLDRLRHPLQVGFQLSLDVGVQHDGHSLSVLRPPLFTAVRIRRSRRVAGCGTCAPGPRWPGGCAALP